MVNRASRALKIATITILGLLLAAVCLLVPDGAGLSEAELEKLDPLSPSSVVAGRETAASMADDDGRASSDPAADSDDESERFTFVGMLVLPNGEAMATNVRNASLTAEDGSVHSFEGLYREFILFRQVPGGYYDLRIEAPPYRHRTQRVHLGAGELSGDVDAPSGDSESTIQERITLWPTAWIPVVIQDMDGRPFSALASGLGFQPELLFADAFRVEARRESFGAKAARSTLEVDPAQPLIHFHSIRGYQEIELPGGIACSIEVLSEPPLWIGLWIHGAFHSERRLLPGAGEVFFQIDTRAIDASLASVALRLIDRSSGAPVRVAEATLKADADVQSRSDLSNVEPNEDGKFLFKRAIPGQYELTITRDGYIIHRRVQLAAGQHLDMGAITIGSGPALKVRVVDIHGRALSASIEIAPLESGKCAWDLYPLDPTHLKKSGGAYMLPIPERKSVVRARLAPLNGPLSCSLEIGSLNMLVDPDDLPDELVILAQDPVDLIVDPAALWRAEHRLTCEDEHGIIVASAQGADSSELKVGLIPGSYVVRRWEEKREIGALNVSITVDSKVLRCP